MQNVPVRHALALRLTPLVISIAIILLVMATPSRASAQVTGSWNCGSSSQCEKVMGGRTGTRQFQTADECHAWGQINIPGGYSCSGGGGGGGNSVMSLHVPAVVALFQAAVLGGGIGAAAGSMGTHPATEQTMVTEGGLAGAALWGFLAMSVNTDKWSRGSEIVVGTITGCTAGAAKAVFDDNELKTEATSEIQDKDKMTKTIQTGCAIGAAGGAAMEFMLNKLPPFRRLRRGSHPVSVINRGQNVGLSISW